MMSFAHQPQSTAIPIQHTPAIVDARCRTPAEVAVWRAIDRLLQSGRTSIGSRELATAAGVSRRALSARRCPRTGALLPGILERLVQLGLLQIVGYQRVGNFPQPRPIFAIDHAALAAASGEQGSAPPAPPAPSAPPAAHAECAAVTPAAHGAPLHHDGVALHHAAWRNREPVHGAPLHQIQREQERDRERPAPMSNLHFLPVPSNAYPLPADPHTLWRDLHPTPRNIDLRLLDAFAAEHDASTGGCGAYWVGRAILALALTHDAPPIRLLKAVLDRWRSEGSYGSDAATYRSSGAAQGGSPAHPSPAKPDVLPAAQVADANGANGVSDTAGASGASVADGVSDTAGADGASVADGVSGASVAADAPPAPVAHYTRRTGVQPSREQAARIAATVRDMAAWDAVLSDWLANGWRLTNVGNLLDAYAKRTTRNAPPVSDTPIVLAVDLDPSERERWLARFRAAPLPERAQVLAAFHAARAG